MSTMKKRIPMFLLALAMMVAMALPTFAASPPYSARVWIIDTAIDLMRRKHKKGEFYYWILYYAYLSPQQCENAGAILQLLETKGISISLRTYYVHRDEAIEVLSSILWGYTSQDCEKITNLLTPD